MNSDLPILSISGYEASGKDTLGDLMVRHWGFEHVDGIWWIKEDVRKHLKQGVADGWIASPLVEGYLSYYHDLKDMPLSFHPFNGLSSRQYQQKLVAEMTPEQRMEKLIREKLLPRKKPIVITGTRWKASLDLWRNTQSRLSLPIHMVWITNPDQGPITPFELQDAMYHPPDWFNAVITNPRGNPEAMLKQLADKIPSIQHFQNPDR